VEKVAADGSKYFSFAKHEPPSDDGKGTSKIIHYKNKETHRIVINLTKTHSNNYYNDYRK
jgi:hypothetical protein